HRAVAPVVNEYELAPHQVLDGREDGREGGGGRRPARSRRAPGQGDGEEDDGEGRAPAPGEGPAASDAVATPEGRRWADNRARGRARGRDRGRGRDPGQPAHREYLASASGFREIPSPGAVGTVSIPSPSSVKAGWISS